MAPVAVDAAHLGLWNRWKRRRGLPVALRDDADVEGRAGRFGIRTTAGPAVLHPETCDFSAGTARAARATGTTRRSVLRGATDYRSKPSAHDHSYCDGPSRHKRIR